MGTCVLHPFMPLHLQVANLGAGAFAHVEWAVLHRPNGEDMNVAVKRLRRDLISNDQDFADFVREGALLKRLRNPCGPSCCCSVTCTCPKRFPTQTLSADPERTLCNHDPVCTCDRGSALVCAVLPGCTVPSTGALSNRPTAPRASTSDMAPGGMLAQAGPLISSGPLLCHRNIVEFVGLGFRTDQGPGDTVSAASMFIVQVRRRCHLFPSFVL